MAAESKQAILLLYHSDCPDNYSKALERLSRSGKVDLATAVTSKEALRMLGSRPFDAIVLDIDKPVEGIQDLVRMFKRAVVDLQVIIYAGRNVSGLMPGIFKAGADFIMYRSDDPERQYRELCGIIDELVKRVAVEKALHRREKDFRAIVTKSADAMIVVDRDGNALYVNPAAESMYNLNSGDMIGRMFGFPLILEDPVEMYIVREYRTFIAVEMRMVEVEWGEQPAYLISLRDITWHVRLEEELSAENSRLETLAGDRATELVRMNRSLAREASERRRAEAAVRKSDRRYRQLVELAREGIWVADEKGKTTYANSRMGEMLGYDIEKLIGIHPAALVKENYKHVFTTMLEKARLGCGDSCSLELSRYDRSTIHATMDVSPIIDDAGSYEGTVMLVTDVTDRLKAEQDLKEAKGMAELYLDLMGHDINNLNQIGIGYLEMALDTTDPAEVKTLIAKPLEVMNDTSKIISNVRKLQQLQSRDMRMKPVDLCNIMETMQQRYTKNNGRTINICVDTVENCVVMANELIEDVFSNLIDNSVKHSSPAVPLEINIRFRKLKKEKGDYLMCTVEDNGPGIPDSVKDKIFLRFKRGPTKAHGKGLGLYIVKTLVEDCKGRIWVEDRVTGDYKKGTRFVIVLPVSQKVE